MPLPTFLTRPNHFAALPEAVVRTEIIARLALADQTNFAATCQKHHHDVDQYHGTLLSRYPEHTDWHATLLAQAPTPSAYARALRPKWRAYVVEHPDMAAWRCGGAAAYTLEHGKPAVLRFRTPWRALDASLNNALMETVPGLVERLKLCERQTENLSQKSPKLGDSFHQQKATRVLDVLSQRLLLIEHRGAIGFAGGVKGPTTPKLVWPQAHILHYHEHARMLTLWQQEAPHPPSLHIYEFAGPEGLLPSLHAAQCRQAVHAPNGAHVALQFNGADGGVLVLPNHFAPQAIVFMPHCTFAKPACETRPATVWLNDRQLLLQRQTPGVDAAANLTLRCFDITAPRLAAAPHPEVQCQQLTLHSSPTLAPLPGSLQRSASLLDHSGLSCAAGGNVCITLGQRHANNQVDVLFGELLTATVPRYQATHCLTAALQFTPLPSISGWSTGAGQVALWWGTQLLLLSRTATATTPQTLQLKAMATSKKGPNELAFSPNGEHVALYTPQQLQIYPTSTGRGVFKQSLSPRQDAVAPSQRNLQWSTLGTRLRCGKQLILLTEQPKPAAPPPKAFSAARLGEAVPAGAVGGLLGGL